MSNFITARYSSNNTTRAVQLSISNFKMTITFVTPTKIENDFTFK